jgi:molybdate-binding protein
MALAALAGGFAVCAATTPPATACAGLTTIPLGRASLDIVIRRSVLDRDSAVGTLLDALPSRSLVSAPNHAGYDSDEVAAPPAQDGAALTSRVVHRRDT